MTRIEDLLATCIKQHIDVAVISGRPLNYEGNAGTYWNVHETNAVRKGTQTRWRPTGVAHMLMGRLAPDTPPPTMDEESVRSGIGNTTVQAALQHRICLIVPQRAEVTDPKSDWYQAQYAVAENAAKAFASASSLQGMVRILAIPTCYPVRTAGAQRDRTDYLVQHFPLVMESDQGAVLWEHPEAQAMCNGTRIASAALLTTHTTSQKALPNPAIVHAQPSWYQNLYTEATNDGVPEERIAATIRRRRIRHYLDNGLSEHEAETSTDAELKALPKPRTAAVPSWYEELMQEALEDGVAEDRMIAAIRRRRVRFHQSNGLSEQEAEARTDQEIAALTPQPEVDTSWFDRLLSEAREDGVAEDRIPATIRRRRIQEHTQAGMSPEEASRVAEKELADLAPKSDTSDTPAPSRPRAKQTGNTVIPPSTPSGDGEPAKEKTEASRLIEAILATGKIDVKTLSTSCSSTPSFIYMLKDGTRRGLNYLDHLHKIHDALRNGTALPSPLAPREKGAKAKEKTADPTGPRHERL